MNDLSQGYIWIILGPLIAWRLYSRLRRLVTRQKFTPWRSYLILVLFPLILLGLCASLIAKPTSLLLVVAAILIGGFLGRYGLNSTRFEQMPDGLYYQPNAHLGIALSALLICRIGYRLLVVSTDPGAMAGSRGTPGALTVAIFAVLASYYVVYAIGLLRRGRVQGAAPVDDIAPPRA